jgi:hemophore-related protein
MVKVSLAKLAAGCGGLVFALSAATGVASADPLDAAVNTTCNYGQVMAALNATDPASAAKFNQSRMAQSMLQQFLDSGPVERQQRLQGLPPQYVGTIERVAAVCNNY